MVGCTPTMIERYWSQLLSTCTYLRSTSGGKFCCGVVAVPQTAINVSLTVNRWRDGMSVDSRVAILYGMSKLTDVFSFLYLPFCPQLGVLMVLVFGGQFGKFTNQARIAIMSSSISCIICQWPCIVATHVYTCMVGPRSIKFICICTIQCNIVTW